MNHRAIVPCLLMLPVLCACAIPPGQARDVETSLVVAATPAPPSVNLAPYVETLAKMAPGDPARQQAELAATLATAQQQHSAANNLRYALALGTAGHAGSNPVEAKRLIAELLATPNSLDPAETTVAGAFLREFDARVVLYAELARQREESEQQLRSHDTSADKRAEALAVENRALRRALAEAERKLEAVAEMERALLEQASETELEAPPRP
jgi:hypothetical protein